jgi:hypothetical protein
MIRVNLPNLVRADLLPRLELQHALQLLQTLLVVFHLDHQFGELQQVDPGLIVEDARELAVADLLVDVPDADDDVREAVATSIMVYFLVCDW